MASPEVLISKAAGYFASGNLKGAANLCRKVLKGQPRHADALHLLGVVTYKAGDAKRAARYLKEAAALRASDAEILRNLAFAQRDSGHPAAAESFRRAIVLDPNDIVSHFQLGVLLGERYEHAEAILHFDEVLSRDSRNGQALYNRANALLSIGRFVEAVSDFALAAQLLPSDYRVFAGWGATFYQLERYKDAREKYRLALEIGPPAEKAANLMAGIGDGYLERGDFDSARANYEKARSLEPDNTYAVLGLAALLERERDYQASYDLIRPFVDSEPPDVAVTIAFAKVAPQMGEAETAVERLRGALANEHFGPHQKRRLHFALGKLLDSAEEFESAFDNYRAANGLYAESYDPGSHTGVTDLKIQAIDQSRAAGLRLRKAPSDRPVFILGMPRSGTTLVEQILASHPQVAAGGEMPALGAIVRDLTDRLAPDADFAELIERIDPAMVEAAAQSYLEALHAVNQSASRVTDKMPHNFEHLWLIAAAFPGAPVIHCTRHPLDTCLSCYFQDFAGRHPYTRDLAHLGQHYIDYLRLMSHWRDTLGLNMLDVAYEDVVADAEALSRRIVSFCSLDWDPACLNFHENRRFVGTASYDQVRRPIYNRSVGRYRHYESHIGELKDALQVPAN